MSYNDSKESLDWGLTALKARYNPSMDAKELKASIEANWRVWESYSPMHFTGMRFMFYYYLNLPPESWHDYKVILETVIAEKLEKKGK
jgi:hypothetical protein